MMAHDPVEHVLELALGELSPSLEDKARHRVTLGLVSAARLAPGAPAGVLPAQPGAGAMPSGARGWTALRASGGAGWLAGALLLGAGVGLGFWLRGAVEPTLADVTVPVPVQPVTLSVPSPSSAPAAAPPAPSEAMGLGVEPRRAEARASHASPVRTRSFPKPEPRAASGAGGAEPFTPQPFVPQPFDEELALLQRVERALRGDNPSLALVLLGELDERFSKTRLGEEREAARRIAECRLQLPGWRQRAERFLSEQPSSMYAQRVRAACVSE